MTRISIVHTWLCALGVIVISGYCILVNCKNTKEGQKEAERIAERIAKQGTVAEYKSKNRRCTATKKTTKAKVTDKDVKLPTYISNPLYAPFTNALHILTEEYAAAAKDGDVTLTNGFVLTAKDGKPSLKFPEMYKRIGIGGVAMGKELKDAEFNAHRKRADDSKGEKVSDVGVSQFRRLDEPEFYCTDVTYSVLPATMQVDAIRMHGKLEIGNTSKAYEMVEEIAGWMAEDYGAVDQNIKTPAGTLALKKLKVGNGMDVEVRVNWNKDANRTEDDGDAFIDISFVTGELVEENRYQCQKLGEATDAARISTLNETGVNYFSVRPTVNEEAVKNKVVY